jgi:hypothetical protein
MSLTDPNLKTARAKEHLDALDREWAEFLKSQPCTFRCKDNVKTGQYQIKIELVDPSAHLSVIAGDIFFCLRSSLDQLIWALATHFTESYAVGTQFPIFDKRNKNTAARFNTYLAGLPKEAIAIIDSLQPYHGRNRAGIEANLLWKLNKLCNIDKHRRIPVHSGIVDFMLPDAIPRNLVTLDNDGVMSFPLAMKDQVKLYPTVNVGVTFGDTHEGIEINRAGIDKIYKLVADDVIPRFARFCK